jgi:hypothetical protein
VAVTGWARSGLAVTGWARSGQAKIVMEQQKMEAADDSLIDFAGITGEVDDVSGRGGRGDRARPVRTEPLFRRFAIPKEWRQKDNDGGG